MVRRARAKWSPWALAAALLLAGCGDPVPLPKRPPKPGESPAPPRAPAPAERRTVFEIHGDAAAVDYEDPIPEKDRESVEALLGHVRGTDLMRRLAAVALLGSLGPEAKPAVEVLKTLLEHEFADHRVEAAIALWRITGDVQPCLRTLIDVIERGDDTARMDAAFAVEEMGPTAEAAVPSLVRVLEEKEGGIRTPGIRFDSSRPVIGGAMIEVSPKSAAADALGAIGPAAKAAIPALEALRTARADYVREAAVEALEAIKR